MAAPGCGRGVGRLISQRSIRPAAVPASRAFSLHCGSRSLRRRLLRFPRPRFRLRQGLTGSSQGIRSPVRHEMHHRVVSVQGQPDLRPRVLSRSARAADRAHPRRQPAQDRGSQGHAGRDRCEHTPTATASWPVDRCGKPATSPAAASRCTCSSNPRMRQSARYMSIQSSSVGAATVVLMWWWIDSRAPGIREIAIPPNLSHVWFSRERGRRALAAPRPWADRSPLGFRAGGVGLPRQTPVDPSSGRPIRGPA
jgi:hypothetical protein